MAALVAAIALLGVLPGVCPCPDGPPAESSGAHACCPSSAPEIRAPQNGCCPEAADDAVMGSVATPIPVVVWLDHVAGAGPAGTVRPSPCRPLAVFASSPSPILRI
jgi:hypothetical protein